MNTQETYIPETVPIAPLIEAFQRGAEEGDIEAVARTAIVAGGLARVLASIEGRGRETVAGMMRDNFAAIAKDRDALAAYSALLVGALPQEAYASALQEYAVN